MMGKTLWFLQLTNSIFSINAASFEAPASDASLDASDGQARSGRRLMRNEVMVAKESAQPVQQHRGSNASVTFGSATALSTLQQSVTNLTESSVIAVSALQQQDQQELQLQKQQPVAVPPSTDSSAPPGAATPNVGSIPSTAQAQAASGAPPALMPGGAQQAVGVRPSTGTQAVAAAPPIGASGVPAMPLGSAPAQPFPAVSPAGVSPPVQPALQPGLPQATGVNQPPLQGAAADVAVTLTTTTDSPTAAAVATEYVFLIVIGFLMMSCSLAVFMFIQKYSPNGSNLRAQRNGSEGVAGEQPAKAQGGIGAGAVHTSYRQRRTISRERSDHSPSQPSADDDRYYRLPAPQAGGYRARREEARARERESSEPHVASEAPTET